MKKTITEFWNLECRWRKEELTKLRRQILGKHREKLKVNITFYFFKGSENASPNISRNWRRRDLM